MNLAKGYIEVKAKNAKTKARRLVPILPNLAQWLAPYAAPFGRVVPFADFGHQHVERMEKADRTPVAVLEHRGPI